jgi:HEPN domain-containing protein
MSDLNIQEAIRWLEYARQDIATVERMLQEEEFVFRHACFWSQQAAEKALKAIFIYLQIDYPWRHDLDALRSLLPDDWSVKHQKADLSRLTEWAVEARYPGEWDEASFEDAQWAYRQAKVIVESVRAEFRQRGILTNQGGEK